MVPLVTYEAENCSLIKDERRNLNVIEITILLSTCSITRMDRERNEELRYRFWVKENICDKMNPKVLKWFGHFERLKKMVK